MRHVRTATLAVVPAALAVLAVGCGRTPKVDNPVLGPPPPRVSMDDSRSYGGEAFGDESSTPAQLAGHAPVDAVRTVAARANGDLDDGRPDPTSTSAVVARVNGEPIFEGDVLEPYLANLEKTRDQMTEGQYASLRGELVARDLEGHIERRLLIQALRNSLKAEQFTSIESRLEEMFEAEVAADMRTKVGVATNYELARYLEDEGQSLDGIRRSFVNQQLGMVYVGQNTKKEFEIGRADLVNYYEGHRDEYEIKPQVRWQRLQIKFNAHGGKQEAFKLLEQAVAELKAKRPFEEVIRDHSDGSHAEKGGAWDWTRRGELADERIENALFQLEIGTLSQVFADDDSYQIVRVVERKEGGFIAFEEVQDEIQLAVDRQLKERETNRVLGELKTRAEITSVLDDQKKSGSQISLPFR